MSRSGKSATIREVPPRADRNSGVARSLTLKNICLEIIELDVGTGRYQIRLHLAQIHSSQHPAANAQVGARAITARRLNHKDGPRQFHIIGMSVGEFDRTGVDIRSGSLNPPSRTERRTPAIFTLPISAPAAEVAPTCTSLTTTLVTPSLLTISTLLTVTPSTRAPDATTSRL